jgi:hypothetical protein
MIYWRGDVMIYGLLREKAALAILQTFGNRGAPTPLIPHVCSGNKKVA